MSIREIARGIARRFIEFDGCAQADLADAVDNALRAERERCARTADTHEATHGNIGGYGRTSVITIIESTLQEFLKPEL